MRLLHLYRTTVGKKIVMAVTGAILLSFVVGHLAGNLKIFQGQEKFDTYAHWLREIGHPVLAHEQFLWVARIGLLVAVGLHIVTATQLTLGSWAARDVGYQRAPKKIGFSYASYTMRWGGVVVAVYVIYHLAHLTWGTAHHDFTSSPYHNVVSGFRIWWVGLIYIAVQIPLGLHIYHGIWSALQTIGANHPNVNAVRRPIAGAIAALIVIGYVSIPVGVWIGLVE